MIQVAVMKLGNLLGGWKFATNANFKHSIYKIMPDRPEKHRDMGCEYCYNLSVFGYLDCFLFLITL